MENTSQESITTPRVSILMLTYNRAHYLPESIRSVIEQSYRDWELIIIDDGSTDSTPEAVALFSDPRITYVRHRENAGLFARRTESLTRARSEYVAVIDSDDVWHDCTKLQKQVGFMDSNPDHALVGTFIKRIDLIGNPLGTTEYYTDDSDIRAHILIHNQFTHSSVLMRTSMLKKTKGYQPVLAEDLELFLQLGREGAFANLPEHLTSHRVHPESENDHGIKMATAVHAILAMHRGEYPNALHAWVVSYLRLFRGRIKALFDQ